MTKHHERILETLAQFDSLPDSAWVRNAVICRHLDISNAVFWRKVKAGTLPQPLDGRICVGEYRKIRGGK